MNKTSIKALAIATIATLSFSNCASIVTKTSYPISFNSNPIDADLVITDKKGNEVYSGRTPATVNLKSGAGFFSKAAYQIKISYPGYDDQVTTIKSSIEGWYFGNILFGGLIGMLIVDPATGAMWKLDTQAVNVRLEQSRKSDEASLQIIDVKDVPDTLRKNMVRVN